MDLSELDNDFEENIEDENEEEAAIDIEALVKQARRSR